MSALKEPLLHEESSLGASVPEAVLSLVKICIGVGILALPYGFMRGGLLSIPGLVVIGLWQWWTSQQLLAARAAIVGLLPTGRSAYSAIVDMAMGRYGVLLLEGCLLVQLIGVCASLQIQATTLLNAALPIGRGLCLLLNSLALIPLAIPSSVSALSRISAVGLIVLLLDLVVVAVNSLEQRGPAQLFHLPERLLNWSSPAEFAEFFGIACFSFGVQSALLPVQTGMRQPQLAASALAIALGVVVASYMVVGVLLSQLYADAEGGVQQVVILNLPEGTPVSRTVQLCSALVATLSYPLPLMPVVEMLQYTSITRALEWRGDEAVSDREGAGDAERPPLPAAVRQLRLLLLLTTSLIASVMPSFGNVAGFIGCLTVITSQVLPPIVHLQLVTWQRVAGGALRDILAAAADMALVAIGIILTLYFGVLTGAKLME